METEVKKKVRKDKITVEADPSKADETEGALKEVLHARAKLKREDGKKVVFTFYPTKSEYFLIVVKIYCLTSEKPKD